MRRISAAMEKRLNNRIQTASTGAAPSTDLWISRPTTALTQAQFLERQTVTATGSSDLSIAVCHPRFGASNNRIYLACIQDGVAKVSTSRTYVRMDAHIWVDTGFEEPAQAVSIAFDGRMPKNRAGQIEFITEDKPWVFWVNAGALYARKLGTEATVTLAESGCTDVSAVRAMWSEVGGFDFGLCVFFILSGTIYYRQLIGGEWMDAAPVAFGPDGVTWVEIAAQRTWDYRVALQAKASDGAVYELFTQFMGVGKQLTEHIEAHIKAEASYIAIDYTDTKIHEHIEASVNPSAKRIYALSSVPVSAANVDDGTGNYGTIVHVGLDYPVSNVDGNSSNFILTDGNGATYTCTNSVASEDGMTLILTFVDFNPAEGTTLTVDYVPGTIQSPATAMEAFSFSFTPENLVAPNIPVPEPVEAWNLDAEGTEVALRFSQALVGDVTGYETPVGYVQRSIDMSGATVTTLNRYSSSTTGAKVIDGSLSTYWRGTTAVNWIQFQLAEAKIVTSLRMYMGSYYIKKFTVSGSNDGEIWTQIGGEYTGASSTTAQWYDIELENNESYLYYRIDTLTAYSTRIYLYEVELLETVPIGNETNITATGQTYEYVPGGAFEAATGTVIEVSETTELVTVDPEDSTVIYLKFASGNTKSLRNMVGNVSIEYSGGTLRGLGGPVADFVIEFAPTGLDPKHHPNTNEHINSTITPIGNLIQTHYSSVYEVEHLETAINPSGALIHMDDI